MELRDRLEEILGEGKSEALIKSTGGIQHYVPGQSLLTEYGSCYCVSTEYPAGYMYGHHSLGSVMELDAESVCVAGKDSRFFSFDTKDCIFLDAETTGLHGGAGTCAFLIGVGFYKGDTFHVQQIFMRDYDEETALLSTLSRLVKNRRFIVTYNGKSFDVPLIESRLIMSRMKQYSAVWSTLTFYMLPEECGEEAWRTAACILLNRGCLGLSGSEICPAKRSRPGSSHSSQVVMLPDCLWSLNTTGMMFFSSRF